MSYVFKFLFLSIFLFSTQLIQAQIGNVISRKQPKISSEKTTSRTAIKNILESQIIQLTKSITNEFESDEQKSRAIFNWIVTNIAYDTQLQLDQKLQRKIYTSEKNVIKHVLSRKMALCGGYAFLFKRMCKAVNIKAEFIHGYTKTKGLKRTDNKVHHTWNTVNINGKWQLLDISWARSQRSNGIPNMAWFNTPPQNFIKSHLPENPQWTLLDSNITLAAFDLD